MLLLKIIMVFYKPNRTVMCY